MNLILRRCTRDDVDIIYNIINDSTVRENSFNNNLIPYENHVRWYNDSLNNNTRLMYIITENNDIIGQIRLDKHDDIAIISYAIESNNRNKGYGTKVLNLIKLEAIRNNISIIEGFVKQNNIASIKAFRKNGFIEFKEDDCIRYVYLLKGDDYTEIDKDR